MKTVYKLTDASLQTHGGYQWAMGETAVTSGEGKLCGPGWLHFYAHPLLAVLLNPIHADFYLKTARLFRADADGEFKDDRGLKGGCTRLTLMEELALPVVTGEQKIKFAILCAKTCCSDDDWNAWADGWLSGKDRSAFNAANATYAAYHAANHAAAYAANAAYRAAYAAYRAAYAANAANAAYAANHAANAANTIDFIALAEKAVA